MFAAPKKPLNFPAHHSQTDLRPLVSSLALHKSTSDLAHYPDHKKIRRRASSKGGLAYLAARRGSRESIKSEFSNEEVGPLVFQAPPGGRVRRTSNFLELPSEFSAIFYPFYTVLPIFDSFLTHFRPISNPFMTPLFSVSTQLPIIPGPAFPPTQSAPTIHATATTSIGCALSASAKDTW